MSSCEVGGETTVNAAAAAAASVSVARLSSG
jgi:hypothetical protein